MIQIKDKLVKQNANFKHSSVVLLVLFSRMYFNSIFYRVMTCLFEQHTLKINSFPFSSLDYIMFNSKYTEKSRSKVTCMRSKILLFTEN